MARRVIPSADRVRCTDANASFEQDDNDDHERRLLFNDDDDLDTISDVFRCCSVSMMDLFFFLIFIGASRPFPFPPVTKRYTNAFYDNRAISVPFGMKTRVARISSRLCSLYVCLYVFVYKCHFVRRKQSTKFEISVCFVVKFRDWFMFSGLLVFWLVTLYSPTVSFLSFIENIQSLLSHS